MAKGKKSHNVKPKGPQEWIYICEEKTMRQIYEILNKEENFVTEYWEAAGILEISLSEIGNIDIEQSEEENVYWVTVSLKGYEAAVDAMKQIEKICGGEFTVDN